MNITTFDRRNTKYILGIMKTTTSLKIDKDIKDKAAKLAASLGLSLSTVINHSLKKFITDKTIKLYKKILDDTKKGKNIVGPFDNTKDLMASLLKK